MPIICIILSHPYILIQLYSCLTKNNIIQYIQYIQSNRQKSNSNSMMPKTSLIIPHQQYQPPSQPQLSPLLPNQRAFQRWMYMNRNNLQHETPIRIQESFKNLQSPLTFIRGPSIKKLERQTDHIQDNLVYERQYIAQMSKSTYKRVISRDQIDYQFGRHGNNDENWYRSSHHDYQKREQKKKGDNTKTLQKRDELLKKFIHNEHQSDIQQKIDKKPLTLQIIKQIDTKDYEQKYKEIDLYEVFLRKNQDKHVSAFTDISQNYDMDQLLSHIRFNLIDRDSHYSAKSGQYLFKAEEELDFWRRYSNQGQDFVVMDEIEVMKRCHDFNPKQPSYMHLLDFASNKLDSQILSKYFQLKKKQEAQMKIGQDDENLEQEYNKKKQEYDFLRQMKMRDKTQRIAIKYTKNTAQTIDNLEDQSFDSYFEEVAKNLLIRLKELNRVRDTVMERRQTQTTKKTMLINIGHEIKNILFKLLAMTLEGEEFVNYDELMEIPQQAEAEKKILEILYHDFHRVKNLEVDGIAKTTILDIYLQERQKNEKMFELLGRLYVPQKTGQKKTKTPSKATSRTPTKLAKSKK